jgi:hypothetical protein
MKKLLLLTALLSSPIFAQDDIEVVARISNQSIKAKEFDCIKANHIVNIKNRGTSISGYVYEICAGIPGVKFECMQKRISLKPGATFNDHDRSGICLSLDKRGSYPLVATTRVNDTVTDAHAVLTVR